MSSRRNARIRRRRIRSVVRRAAATVPFFTLAAVLLGFFSHPVDPLPGSIVETPPVLIATTESLRPAFDALESWNRAQGCLSYVVTVDPAGVNATRGSLLAYVGAVCARQGVGSVLLGGDTRHVPLAEFLPGSDPVPGNPGMTLVPVSPTPPGSIPEGVQVSRIPVRNLDEAWAFVEACRSSGKTLDRLMGAVPVDVAVRVPAADPAPRIFPNAD